MASIVDAFSESISENLSIVKIILYAIPVYFCTKFFLRGEMGSFYFYAAISAILFLGLLTQGINNVRMNKKEILTLNPLSLGKSILLTSLVMLPQIFIWYFIGHLIVTMIQIPIDLPHTQLIFSIIVWSIIGSILMTAYLSFAKYLNVMQGFNYKVILESCVDIFICLLFFVPQLAIADVFLVGPVAYLFSFFNLPFTHWGFIFYCSCAFVVNISIIANYLAQSAYEQIKGSNEEYDDNHNKTNIIEDSVQRMN